MKKNSLVLLSFLAFGLFLVGCTSNSPTPTVTYGPTPTVTYGPTATYDPTVNPTFNPTITPGPSVDYADCDQQLSLNANERMKLTGGPYLTYNKVDMGVETSVFFEVQSQARMPLYQFNLNSSQMHEAPGFTYRLLSFGSDVAVVCVIKTSASPSPTNTDSSALTSITVIGMDGSFSPNQITIPSGRMVTIVFKNEGTKPHTFTIPDYNVDTGSIEAGAEKTVTFTATESTAGNHQILCTMPGHAAAGMTGTLIVTAN